MGIFNFLFRDRSEDKEQLYISTTASAQTKTDKDEIEDLKRRLKRLEKLLKLTKSGAYLSFYQFYSDVEPTYTITFPDGSKRTLQNKSAEEVVAEETKPIKRKGKK